MEYKIAPSACEIVFGIRYLSAEKVDKDTDVRVLAAKKHGLSVWSGRRYPPGGPTEPMYYLLVGKWFGCAGYDGSCERSVSITDLRHAVKTTTKKLAEAGFAEAPALWIQCKYD